jgi:hypothetical protein
MRDNLMPAYQIPNFAPIGSLLKRPRPRARRNDFGRNTRIEEPTHLQAIRKLPCLRCGVEGFTEAAHVRMTNSAANKRSGLGVKPDDRWTVPLCAGCHQRDPDSQHNVGELTFWHHVGLNPLLVCEALHKASPDIEAMRAVVVRFISARSVSDR